VIGEGHPGQQLGDREAGGELGLAAGRLGVLLVVRGQLGVDAVVADGDGDRGVGGRRRGEQRERARGEGDPAMERGSGHGARRYVGASPLSSSAGRDLRHPRRQRASSAGRTSAVRRRRCRRVAGRQAPRKRVPGPSGNDVGSSNSSRKGPIMIRNEPPVRTRYPMRRLSVIVTALVLALCLGLSSAIAQPMDQTPRVQPPPAANVYVPPPDLWQEQDLRSPDAIDAGAGPLPASAKTNTDGDNSPWLVIGLAAGGFVVLSGCVVGFRRTRRKRPVA
jgi:hypothetical protein